MRQARRMSRRRSTDSNSSASTSPERVADDDNDSLMLGDNESQSSLALSGQDDQDDSLAREMAERSRISPISRLPAELIIAVFQKLGTSDLRSCMLVSKEWARSSVTLLWHRPKTDQWWPLHSVIQSLRSANSYFDYSHSVKRLNLSALQGAVSDGVLLPFQTCKRIERLTLTNCSKLTDLSIAQLVDGNKSLLALDVTHIKGVTDITMKALAKDCYRLQGLNITKCVDITDHGLVAVAQKCPQLKRLKFNHCTELTSKSVLAFAAHCRQVLEIDLQDCRLVEDDAVTALLTEMTQLRELRLSMCIKITDEAFLNLPYDANFDSLRILDLTGCEELQDYGVQKIIQSAPRLRNLVLAKCRQLTDRAVMAITRLGKSLHYIHLGHCARITDAGVTQLVRMCNRIRYIDLACCVNLTDASIMQLASLPKLKRIGLVKCGNITDRSIFALAKPRNTGSLYTPSALERVHLSYCTNLSLNGISALLNSCPRLTHLSLTGVAAFLREDLIVFCRDAPPEFNEHQRELFCVFSNSGVERLRDYLRANFEPENEQHELATPSGEDMPGHFIETPLGEHPPQIPLPHHAPLLGLHSQWMVQQQQQQNAHAMQLQGLAIPPPPPPPPAWPASQFIPGNNHWGHHDDGTFGDEDEDGTPAPRALGHAAHDAPLTLDDGEMDEESIVEPGRGSP